MNRTNPDKILSSYLTLALLEGLAALAWLLALPVASGAGLLARFSPGRLAVLAPSLALIALFSLILISIHKKPERAQRWSSWLTRPGVYWSVIAASSCLLLLFSYVLALGLHSTDPFLAAYFQRLAPYAAWGLLLALQTPIFLRSLRYGWGMAALRPYRLAFKASLVAILLLSLLAFGMAATRLGFAPDLLGWGAPGTPLLPWQVWLALTVVGLAALGWRLVGRFWPALAGWLRQGRRGNRLLDVCLALLIWIVAGSAWSAFPLGEGAFSNPASAPNYEIYPFSDAAAYDLAAQRLLVGIGFEKDAIRPALSGFIALAQGVSGIGYPAVIAWQVSLLALIPVVIYLLGGAVHHRLTGLLAALLIILREQNAIRLYGVIDVAHVKLMLSDLPTTLGVLLFTYLLILWIKDPQKRALHPLAAGGVAGLTMLVRAQVVLLVPFALIWALIALRRQPRRWGLGAVLMAACLALTLLPWLLRTWSATGKFTLSEAANPTQAGLLGRRYNLTGGSQNAPRLPGESEAEYLDRMTGSVTQFILEHPGETAQFIASHFFHNHVATFLTLPPAYPILTSLDLDPAEITRWLRRPELFWERCCDVKKVIGDLPYWKTGWAGAWAAGAALPALTALLLLGTGLGTAWAAARYAGLLPLVIALAYSLSNALARNSGWRYNLPVDWTGILFYSLGLVQTGFWLATYFRNRLTPAGWLDAGELPPSRSAFRQPFPWKPALVLAGGFCLLVSLIPLAEWAVPERYPAGTRETWTAELEQSPAGQNLGGFLESGGQALVGRAFYPQFFQAGQGTIRGGWPSYYTRDFPRLGFNLVGPQPEAVILPTGAPPEFFPNAADVLVAGCPRQDYFEAQLVLVITDQGQAMLGSLPAGLTCPEP